MLTVGQLAEVLWTRRRRSSLPAATPGEAIRYVLDSLGLTDAKVLEGTLDWDEKTEQVFLGMSGAAAGKPDTWGVDVGIGQRGERVRFIVLPKE